MKNYYKNSKPIINPIKKYSQNPLFGFVILAVVLVVIQLLFMYTDDIVSLTFSKAIAQTMIYSIVCLGLAILEGRAGLTSLGTAGFMGVGSYIAGNILKAANVPLVFVFIATILVAILLGVVVGFISLRIQGLHLLIITLAISEILNEMFNTPNSFTNGSSGLMGVPFPKLMMLIQLNRETTYFMILAVLFFMIVLTLNIINSPTGRAMLAMRNSRVAAQAMGINLLKYRILAFVIATVYAMIGGALYMCYIQGSSPDTWSVLLSLNVLVAVILGGAMSVSGVILGAFIIFGLDLAVLKNIEMFQKYSSASIILSGLLIIFIVVKYPGGLARFLLNVKIGIKKLYVKWRIYTYGQENETCDALADKEA